MSRDDYDRDDRPQTKKSSGSGLILGLVLGIGALLLCVCGGVVLFSADPKHWYAGSRRVLSQRVDPKGAVTFEDLPKGDYVVATVAGMQPPNWYIGRGLDALAATGTKVRLEPSETRAITVRIVPKTVQ